MATISGTLKNASGARPNTKIILTAYKTTSEVVTLAPDTTIITDANGAYSFVCNPSSYNVRIQQSGYPCENVGIIQVYSDSFDGTINDFLTSLKPDDLTPEIVKEVLQYRNEAKAAATEAKGSETKAKSSSDSALASKNEIEIWYDYFKTNYPEFATDYADFESKCPDFIAKYNETVTNAFNANKDAASADSSNKEAQYWAEEADKRAQQIFVSGGVFDPSTGLEYPDVTGTLRDTAYIVSMLDRDKYFKFTSGDLSGKGTANGDVMLYDTPSNKWYLVASGVESALTKSVADTLYRPIGWTPTADDVDTYNKEYIDKLKARITKLENEIPAKPNLLINGNEMVNQRKISKWDSVNVNSYGFDRWRKVSATIKRQPIEEGGFRTGEIHTISWSVGADRTSKQITSPSTGNWDNNDLDVPILATNMKIEFGLVSTSFVPDDPATNLAKCQRYYEVISSASGYAPNNSGAVFLSIDYKVSKRTTAYSIVGKGVSFILYGDSTSANTNLLYVNPLEYATLNGAMLEVRVAPSVIPTNRPVMLVSGDDSGLAVDNEL